MAEAVDIVHNLAEMARQPKSLIVQMQSSSESSEVPASHADFPGARTLA